MRIETITSAQNRKVKELLTLVEKSKARSAAGLFVVEGQRELGHCLDAGFIPETLFICGEVINALNKLLFPYLVGNFGYNNAIFTVFGFFNFRLTA